jgi:hypothetical protein
MPQSRKNDVLGLVLGGDYGVWNGAINLEWVGKKLEKRSYRPSRPYPRLGYLHLILRPAFSFCTVQVSIFFDTIDFLVLFITLKTHDLQSPDSFN